MNKKGLWLAEETLKIIVAVIVIIFLIYFLVSLYYSNKDAENQKFAESSLSSLVEQISLKKSTADIYNPEGWVIISWPYNGQMPKACSNLEWQKCLCICKSPALFGNYLNNCEETGKNAICVQSDFTVRGTDGKIGPLEIDTPPLVLSIDYSSKTISHS